MNGRPMCLGVILCALTAVPASAQNERGFVRGLGGVTFGTAETSTIFGGGGGVNVGRSLQITGELGRISDVLPEDLRDQLDFISALVSLQFGVPVRVDATAPAFYGLGGVRYTMPAGRIRPFAEAQGGFARITFDIDAEVAGIDASREIEDEANLDSVTEFLLGLGGGVTLPVTDRVAIDIGYRYGRIFTEDPVVINTNAVYGAVRFSIQ
jgi:opacity protein-like surface antigen